MNPTLVTQLLECIHAGRATEVGLAAHRLSDGEQVLIDADRSFHAASTMKLPVMMEAFRQARLGLLSLDEPVQVRNRFSSLLDGSPYSLDPADDSERELYALEGQSLPRRELIRLMITASSNLATNVLIEHIRPQDINAYMHDLGADGIRVLRGVEDKAAYRAGLNNTVTARGLMTALLRIARREAVSPADSGDMMEILLGQRFRDMIPALLPAGVRVAHKDGEAADYFHDAGIVFPPAGSPFVLVILTKGYPADQEPAARSFGASLAKLVYDHWVVRS